MMFLGSKHCPRCGATAARRKEVIESGRKCPRCLVEMQSVSIGQATVLECAGCFGLWLDTVSFEKICADREEQSAVLGSASPSPSPSHQAPSADMEKIRYVPCPQCSQLMNRINFARCSGVIVDICKGHGTWFDPDELSGIVQFIRSGGLEVSRQKEKNELEFQREQLRTEQLMAANRATSLGRYALEEDRISGLSAAGGLLKFLIG